MDFWGKWKIRYSAGNTNKVNTVDERIPPMTTVARGRCTSAPAPVARAMGTKPNDATSAVINTGLNRVSDPFIIASSNAVPSSLNLLMKEIITTPFSTATPERAMNPMAAETDNGIPRTHKEKNPPVNASGTPVKTRIAFFTVPNAANNKRNINNKAMGTTTHNR